METRKRKPLSDLTNTFNLIPTSTLRKLVASKPPNSILKLNPIYSDSDTKSGTSIGSSNVSDARNLHTVQFSNDPCRPLSSIASPGDGETKNGASSRRWTTYGPQKESDAVTATVSSTSLLKMKDKGKAITLPSYCSPPGKAEDYGNPIRGSCSSLDKAMEKEKGSFSPFSEYVENMELGKEILNPSSCSFEKGEKGKTILNATGCSIEKTKELRKGILNLSNFSHKKRKEGAVVIRSPSSPSLEKTKEIGKTNASSSSLQKTKDKGKAMVNSSGCTIKKTNELILNPSSCSYEIKKERGVVIRSPSSSSLEKTKERGKTIPNPSSSSFEKTKDKGKAVVNSSGCAIEKTKELILNPYSSSYEKRKERGVAIHSPSSSSLDKTKEIGKTIANLSSPSVEKTNAKGKTVLNPFGSSLQTTKKRGKLILVPSSVENVKDKGASATVPVNHTSRRRKSGKRMIDIGASSCPPLMKTKNGFNESGDVKPSNSWTGLQPKHKKKRCMQQKDANDCCLPKDFIEQQRAYFEEIDNFELPVEEV
ncbi:Hypothetical predicted protein [Olea europaea subsp. europaea]|uniref:Sororin C-terminal region domain-containing protein n=3 Tax=Olea europaea subsp. europaea TaxID=158383 RepID=A0A8S0SGY3_OLEEU|nr:Hypothetical predicted protein [Olea europaea subsp. europaea]